MLPALLHSSLAIAEEKAVGSWGEEEEDGSSSSSNKGGQIERL
jgi:hypothetical protein